MGDYLLHRRVAHHEPWRAFDAAWFRRHQRLLLWLVNTPVLRRIIRALLCISDQEPLDRLYPHAYRIGYRHGRATLVVHTHAKYAKRLYRLGWPLWWLLHVWDALIADRWIPAWSYGFATLTVYPDPYSGAAVTTDGQVTRETISESWATIRAAADGHTRNVDSAINPYWRFRYDGAANTWNQLTRSFFLFDTSPIGPNATISSAVLSLRMETLNDPNAWAGTTDIYESSPAASTILDTPDYDQVGSTSQTGSPKTWASLSTTAYTDFTFNATGRGNINSTGISKFGCRNANYDVGGTTPADGSTVNQQHLCQGYYADAAGTANDPRLVVDYTTSAAGRIPPRLFRLMGAGHAVL